MVVIPDWVDHLERKWDYSVTLDMQPKEVWTIMLEYASYMDENVLTDNPDRVREMVQMIGKMSNYTKLKMNEIKELSRAEFWEYLQGVNDIQKALLKIEKSPITPQDVLKKIQFFKKNFFEWVSNSLKN